MRKGICLSWVAIAALLAAPGCEKSEGAGDDQGGNSSASQALMNDLYDVVNDRDKPCAEARKELDALAESKSEEIAGLAASYQKAKKAGAEELAAIARPIQAGRAAINRFRLRCPDELAAVTQILDRVTGGDIKVAKRDKPRARKPNRGVGHEHGSGQGGGGSGGAGGGGSQGASAGPRPSPETTPSKQDARPPTKADLKRYTKGLEGKGKLMATIETSMGTFECELYEKRAPITVANFVGLARGLHPWVDSKSGETVTGDYFTGIVFHRVIPNFMLQTGDPTGTGTSGPGYKFGDEFHPELRHDSPGIMSMANSGPNTNGSQFFITERPTPHLDNKHSVFGKCDNIDLVKKIARVPKAPGNRSKPANDVFIKQITIHR